MQKNDIGLFYIAFLLITECKLLLYITSISLKRILHGYKSKKTLSNLFMKFKVSSEGKCFFHHYIKFKPSSRLRDFLLFTKMLNLIFIALDILTENRKQVSFIEQLIL